MHHFSVHLYILSSKPIWVVVFPNLAKTNKRKVKRNPDCTVLSKKWTDGVVNRNLKSSPLPQLEECAFLVSKRDQRRAALDAVFHALFTACLTKWVDVCSQNYMCYYVQPIYSKYSLIFWIADLEGIVKRRALAFSRSTRKCDGLAALARVRESSHRLARQGKNKSRDAVYTLPNRYRNLTVLVLESG